MKVILIQKDVDPVLTAINSSGRNLFKYPIGNKELTEKLKQFETLEIIKFNETNGLWEKY